MNQVSIKFDVHLRQRSRVVIAVAQNLFNAGSIYDENFLQNMVE